MIIVAKNTTTRMHVNAHHSEPMEMETLKPGSTRKSSEGWSCSTKLDPLGPEQKPSTFNPSNSLMPKFPAIPSLAALSHARIKTFALGMSHNDRCSRMSQENWSFWGFWRAPFRSWFGYDNSHSLNLFCVFPCHPGRYAILISCDANVKWKWKIY